MPYFAFGTDFHTAAIDRHWIGLERTTNKHLELELLLPAWKRAATPKATGTRVAEGSSRPTRGQPPTSMPETALLRQPRT